MDDFYTPSEKQRQQVQAIVDEVNINVGRFVLEWSHVEGHLRTLELMHNDGVFRPLDSLDGVNLSKTRRFVERVKLLPPAHRSLRRWLLDTYKMRNLILHGMLIFRGKSDSEVMHPAIIHIDFPSTLAAQKGWPRVSQAAAPAHRNSADPSKTFRAEKMADLVAETKQVREQLLKIIESIHKHSALQVSQEQP